MSTPLGERDSTTIKYRDHAHFHLVSAKGGLGIGVPIVMLFTDKATVTTHKHYFLQCPVCGDAVKVNKDVAKGLQRQGEE